MNPITSDFVPARDEAVHQAARVARAIEARRWSRGVHWTQVANGLKRIADLIEQEEETS